MDAISAGASVLTFVELAATLVVRAKELYDFWASVEDAPEDFQSIARDVHLIKDILEEITEHDETMIVRGALEECYRRVGMLQSVVANLAPGFAASKRRTRKWAAIKTVFRKDQIQKIQDSLSATKSSLSLALQTSQAKQIRLQPQLIVDRLAAILLRQGSCGTTVIDVSQDPIVNSSPSIVSRYRGRHRINYREVRRNAEKDGSLTLLDDPEDTHEQTISKDSVSVWETVFGTVIVKKKARPSAGFHGAVIDKLQTTITLRPSSWLAKLGLGYESHASLFGGMGSWGVYRIVPSKSPIFEYCRTGNIRKVQELLSSGKASIWDVDEHGDTPLHHAAGCYQADLCRYLIDIGAQSTRSRSNFSPLTNAIYGENYRSELRSNKTRRAAYEKQIETQRVLMAGMPEDHASEMLHFLLHKFAVSRTWHWHPDHVSFETLLHSSQVLRDDLKYVIEAPKMKEELIARHIWKQASLWRTPGSANCIIDDYDDVLDLAVVRVQEPSVMHACVINKRADISHFLEKGANPHLTSHVDFAYQSRKLGNPRTYNYYKTLDTPTSFALYTSDAFYYWKEELKNAGVSLESFIAQELTYELDMHGEKMPLLLSVHASQYVNALGFGGDLKESAGSH
ncbi:hypothetical protein EG329_010104 [Mollisiaceae sp. DMI_Dod_QoI]|nr:hypothetical protein EG329_010104 [Helotiales sp. DMI_Dod_QoI]